MELWIRSQDKMNLVKIRQISLNYQNNKQIIANYIPDFYPNSGEYYEILGVYKTKGRAIEVLDEIQKLLIPKTIMETYNVDEAEMLDGTIFIKPMLGDIKIEGCMSYIYKMPKE